MSPYRVPRLPPPPTWLERLPHWVFASAAPLVIGGLGIAFGVWMWRWLDAHQPPDIGVYGGLVRR